MKQESLEFLKSEVDFLAHLQAQLANLSPVDIGRRFARFSQYLFAYTEIGENYKLPQQRQETHDGGVDMEAEAKIGSGVAFIQSKYTIRSVDDVDQIISKFQSFESKKQKKRSQRGLFDSEESSEDDFPQYVVITSSKVDGLLTRYLSSGRASVPFYQDLKQKNLIHFLDCVKVYAALLNAYKRSTYLPTNVQLIFDTPFLRDGEVLIGITSVGRIRALYHDFGDSLFLENIREWLGPHGGKQTSKNNRESPNQAIARTLLDAPARFLARNNGLTFRAKKIKPLSDREVMLDEASIVNGCQTTMSIVDVGEGIEAKVVVKIVETDDSWDIAQAANFQTNLDRMELELARDLRPQIIRAEAQKTGLKFASESGHRTAFSVVEELYDETITYEEFRSLFVGLFSRNPSNSFQNNYSELRQELLASLQEYSDRDAFYEKLFKIHISAKSGAANQYSSVDGTDIGDLFQRFWKEEKANYRSYIALLALTYLGGQKVALPVANFSDLVLFIDIVLSEIEKDATALQKAYSYAFKAIALLVLQKHQDKKEQLQAMFGEIQNAKFSNLLTQTRVIAS
jgi:hypothetical protein